MMIQICAPIPPQYNVLYGSGEYLSCTLSHKALYDNLKEVYISSSNTKRDANLGGPKKANCLQAASLRTVPLRSPLPA